MRSVMIPEAITEEPTDLRPLQPTGIGFLSRGEGVDDFSRGECQGQLLVVRRFSPRSGEDHSARLKSLLGQAVERIARTGGVLERVKSFWVLEYAADSDDSTLVTIERYVDGSALYDATLLIEDLL